MAKIRKSKPLGPLPKVDNSTGDEEDWSGSPIDRRVQPVGNEELFLDELPIAYMLGTRKYAPVKVPYALMTTIFTADPTLLQFSTISDKQFIRQVGATNFSVNPAPPGATILTGLPTRYDFDVGQWGLIPKTDFIGGVVYVVIGFVNYDKYYQVTAKDSDIFYERTLPFCPTSFGCDPGSGPSLEVEYSHDPLHVSLQQMTDPAGDIAILMSYLANFTAYRIAAWYEAPATVDITIPNECYCSRVSDLGSSTLPAGADIVIGNTAAANAERADVVNKVWSGLPDVNKFISTTKPTKDALQDDIIRFFRRVVP